MEIKVGNRFQVVANNPNYWGGEPPKTIIYTVTAVNGNRISWDCVGRKVWYRNVTKGMIEEHIFEIKDLVKL